MIFHKLKNPALKWRDFIFDLLFPIECLGCGQEKKWLCSRCFALLPFNKKNVCWFCQQPSSFGLTCRVCKKHYALDGLLVAGDYKNTILKQLIKNYKYRFAKDINVVLGNFISNYLINSINHYNFLQSKPKTVFPLINFSQLLIIAVPLHAKRLKWRGFNQSLLLANSLANNLNIEITEKYLYRIKYNPPQSKLNQAKRKRNLSGSFAWSGPKLRKHILLIDDVATTGTTLNECAKICKANGALSVWGLVVARA